MQKMKKMKRNLFFCFILFILIQKVKLQNDDCEVGEWSSWSSCSCTCGLFCTKEKHRSLKNNEYCTAEQRQMSFLNEKVSCNQVFCPVNCVYSWGAWSSCKGCGSNGQQTSLPVLSQNAKFGGTCNAPSIHKRTCNTMK